MFEAIAIFLIILLLVAVVGHLLWLGMAALVRVLSGQRSKPRRDDAWYDDDAIAAKRLEELHRSGRIDEQTFQKVVSALYTQQPPPPLASRLVQLQQNKNRDGASFPPAIPPEVAEVSSPVQSSPLPPPLPIAQIAPPIAPPPLQPRKAPIAVAPPPPPRPPRKPFSEILKRFMEESNIRWGELIGGLLIVGCSIALVLTFWETIASQPWLRFFLFTAVTSAIFAAGLYTEHRWKLPTTSRGLLLIASLMVPLNFLAFSRGTISSSAISIAQEIVALGIFAAFLYSAGKVLAPRWRIPLIVGLLGPSLVESLSTHLITTTPASTTFLFFLALAAMLLYLAANTPIFLSTRELDQLDSTQANPMLLLLGASTFALLLPLGLLAAKSIDVLTFTHQLSPLLPLIAAPMLAIGLMLWRKIIGSTAIQTTAIALAALAGFMLVGGIVLAWPDPICMIAAGLLAFFILTAVAFFYDIAFAHLLALPALALVFILVFHLVQPPGHADHISFTAKSSELLQSLLSPSTASALLLFILAAAGATDWLARRHLPHARQYRIVATALSILSLALISYHGLGHLHDHGATWIYFCYALLAAGLAWRTRSQSATFLAIALLGLSVFQAIVFRFPSGLPIARLTLAALVNASLLLAAVVVIRLRTKDKYDYLFIEPLGLAAIISSIAAAVFIALTLAFSSHLPALNILALRSLWLSGLLLTIALINQDCKLFGGFQIALAATVVLAVGGLYQNSIHPIFHPWIIQSAAIALGMLSLAWTIFRLVFRRRNFRILPFPDSFTIDSLLAYISLFTFLLMALFAIAPAISHELLAADAQSFPRAWFEPHLLGIRMWLLLGASCIALIATLWLHFRRITILALLVAATGACALIAASFDPQNSSASALRWLLAALLVLGSLPLFFREKIRAPFDDNDLTSEFRIGLLLLTALPILAITLYSAFASFTGSPILGPASTSFFNRIGDSKNYLVPLAAMFFLFIAHAYREKSSVFAFAAALLLNLSITLGYLLHLVTNHHPIGPQEWTNLLHFNVIASAAFAIGWILISRATPPYSTLLITQIALPLIALFALLAVFVIQLIANPATISPIARELSGIYGILAWILTGAASLWIKRATDRQIHPGFICLALIITGTLASLRLLGPQGPANWLSYHALLCASATSGWFMLGVGALSLLGKSDEDISNYRSTITSAVLLLSLVTLALSLRSLVGDPTSPWWCVYGLLVLSPLAIALAFWTMQSLWLYPAALLVNIAISIGWTLGHHPTMTSPILGLIQLNIIILASIGLAFLILELYILRPLRSQVVHVGPPAFHHFAAIASLIAITAITIMSLVSDVFMGVSATTPLLTYAAPLIVAALLMASLYDRDARYSLLSLYIAGLLIAGTILHYFHFRLTDLAWHWVVIVAGYSVFVSYLYMFRASLMNFAQSIGIPLRDNWPARSPGWVADLAMVQSLIAFILAFFAVQYLTTQIPKLAVAAGAFTMAVAVGLLAQDPRESRLKRATLLLGLFGAILCGWAWLPRFGPDLFLNRMVIIMLAMAAVSILYAVGLVKILRRENEWTLAAKKLVPLISIGTAVSLMLVLVAEAMMYKPTGAPIAFWAFLSVSIALVALGAAAIICAIIPGKDPLELSDRSRQAYVYGTEVLLILLAVHLRLVYPAIFQFGIWSRFWPIIVMTLAFVGIGLSELFRRQNRPVLAQPLEKTSILLPLLPVASFWLLTGVWQHQQNVNYALVLLLAGAAWGSLALLRRSFVFGLLSALAGNGALWYLLSQTQSFGFFQHPQLWIIPIAFSILAAAYLNRAHLSAEHMRTLRYVCLMAIYASSTADIMINGINKAPWLPMLLAVLSVAGVMAGILMRIQSFLFLGTLFLLVSIATMIQYAAHQVGQNWPWLVAGILLGAAIIILFALFEKKRTEMLALVDGLKEWQG